MLKRYGYRAYLFLVALLLPVTAVSQPVPPPSTDFIIGVYGQPKGKVAYWRSMGVKTFVHYEPELRRSVTPPVPTVTRPEWRAVVEANGGNYIDDSDDLAADANNPYLLALAHKDEPDLHKTPIETVQALTATYRKLAPRKPIYINFAGPLVSEWGPSVYPGYAKDVDWLAFDFYPYNKNPLRYTPWNVKAVMDRLVHWCGSKPLLIYLECSNQNLGNGGRAPTRQELRATVFGAILHAASEGYTVKGVIWFPQQIGGVFSFNALTKEQEATVKEINSELLAWAASGVYTPPALPQPGTQPATLPSSQPATVPSTRPVGSYSPGVGSIVVVYEDGSRVTYYVRP